LLHINIAITKDGKNFDIFLKIPIRHSPNRAPVDSEETQFLGWSFMKVWSAEWKSDHGQGSKGRVVVEFKDLKANFFRCAGNF